MKGGKEGRRERESEGDTPPIIGNIAHTTKNTETQIVDDGDGGGPAVWWWPIGNLQTETKGILCGVEGILPKFQFGFYIGLHWIDLKLMTERIYHRFAAAFA